MITATQAVVFAAALFAAAGFLVWASIQLSRIEVRDPYGSCDNAGDDSK